jgi:hypothetical protein
MLYKHNRHKGRLGQERLDLAVNERVVFLRPTPTATDVPVDRLDDEELPFWEMLHLLLRVLRLRQRVSRRRT